MRETIGVYIPKSFVRHYTFRVKKKVEKYKDIEKAIYSSRLPLTVQELIAMSRFYSIISFIIGSVLGILLFQKIPPDVILYAARFGPLYGYITSNYNLISSLFPLLGLIFGLIAYKITEYLILSYPFFISNRRKSEIELYLPHAISMMYGMAVGGTPVYEMFKTIAESRHIFGELSKEFLVLVEMIDVFRKDQYDAMRFVRDTTPSPKLSTFLDNMIFVLQGGGKLSDFLRRKSEELIEEKELTFQSFVEFVGLMAEVYISAFIILPLFLLIVLVIMRLMGSGFFEMYRHLIPLILPLTTMMFIWLLKSSMPIPKVELEKYEKRYGFIKANVVDEVRKSFRINRLKMFMNRIKRFFLHPFERRIYEIKLRIVIVHLLIASLVVFLLIYRYFRPEVTFIIVLSVFAVPLIALIELKDRIIRKMEERIPDVFSELAMLNEAGLSVLEGLRVLSTTEMGILTKEISAMKRELEWGVLIPRAFIRLGIRLKSDILSKVIPVVVKALETAPTVKDAFTVVASYAESEVMFKKRLRSSMFLYVIIIYMCVIIFLFVSFSLIKNYFEPFANLSITGGGGIEIAMNLEEMKNTFFQLALTVGALSGLIAGQIGEGNMILGLKHSYAFLVLTYMVFMFFL